MSMFWTLIFQFNSLDSVFWYNEPNIRWLLWYTFTELVLINVIKLAKGSFNNIFQLIDWMVFYAAFNSISVISRRQLALFMLSWVSPVLGWALKYLAHEKTQRIQCGSNPGPLDYESNTLPLSHVGPNIFQDSFNKISSQQLTHGRSYIYIPLQSMKVVANIYRICHELTVEIKFY